MKTGRHGPPRKTPRKTPRFPHGEAWAVKLSNFVQIHHRVPLVRWNEVYGKSLGTRVILLTRIRWEPNYCYLIAGSVMAVHWMGWMH